MQRKMIHLTKILLKISFSLLLFSALSAQDFLGEREVGINGFVDRPLEKTPPPELIIRSLRLAYPEQIIAVDMNPDSLGIFVGDQWFYLKEGRLLPPDKINNWRQYQPSGFYYYPQFQPELAPITEETRQFLREQRLPRDSAWQDAIFHAKTEEEILPHIQEINFMGYPLKIHEVLVPALRKIEAELNTEINQYGKIYIQNFFDQLEQIGGFYWRNILHSQIKSAHSYGTGLDLIPSDAHGKASYWLWLRDENPDWYTLPYDQRWTIPTDIVEIFENNGFVWGGKWRYFDTFHFEYRPDLIYLQKLVD